MQQNYSNSGFEKSLEVFKATRLILLNKYPG